MYNRYVIIVFAEILDIIILAIIIIVDLPYPYNLQYPWRIVIDDCVSKIYTKSFLQGICCSHSMVTRYVDFTFKINPHYLNQGCMSRLHFDNLHYEIINLYYKLIEIIRFISLHFAQNLGYRFKCHELTQGE